jgi:dihydroorotase
MAYDLLIGGGRVLDPGQGIDAALDIGISGDQIVAVGPSLDRADARRVIEVSGKDRLVTPGLIDLHVHVAHGATTLGVGLASCDPDQVGVQAGVTTVLDAGSVGVANFGTLRHHVLPRSQTRVIPFLNVASHAHSMPGWGDVRNGSDVDPRAITACIEANPGLIEGFKLRLIGAYAFDHCQDLIRQAKAISLLHGLPLMVHLGDMFATDFTRAAEASRFVMENLEEGDILTHLMTPHIGGVMADESRTEFIESIWQARDRGVVMDSALGAANFGFDLCRRQAELGLSPHTISSDVTATNREKCGNSLLGCMSRFMAAGYSLTDVIRMTTVNPARALGRSTHIGAIKVGMKADLSIIAVISGKWSFTDATDERFSGHAALIPVQTIKGGQVHTPEWGPYPWGWLPPSEPE